MTCSASPSRARSRALPHPLPRNAALLTLALLSGAGRADAAEASPWAKAAQSQARLIDGGHAAPGGDLLAGLEIRLQPQFITYWRDPGDAGVPPTFSFAGSTNLKSATPRYPAPRKLDEAGAVAFGYADAVTFPILVAPLDPAKPVDLRIAFDYATCHDICLPAHADLHLVLDGEASAEAGRVRDALAAVPRPAAVGGDGTPAILAVRPGADGGFSVVAALPEAAGAALFVEAPDGWAYEAAAPAPDGAGRFVFPVKQLDHPQGADVPPAPVTLTLAAPDGAVEASARLDAAPPKP